MTTFSNPFAINHLAAADWLTDTERKALHDDYDAVHRPRCIGMRSGERCVTIISRYSNGTDGTFSWVVCDACNRRIIDDEIERYDRELEEAAEKQRWAAVEMKRKRAKSRYDAERRVALRQYEGIAPAVRRAADSFTEPFSARDVRLAMDTLINPGTIVGLMRILVANGEYVVAQAGERHGKRTTWRKL